MLKTSVPSRPGLDLPRLARGLWRRLQAVRRPLLRHRHRRLTVETVLGAPFVVLPDVFNPALFMTSEFLARQLGPANASGAVLDMGTGSGVGAVIAVRWARRVVAVDINPEAVRCARLNALLNRVEDRVEVRQGDLFAPVTGERFDLVLFNPPFFRGRPCDLYDHAWRSEDVIPRFLGGLTDALAPGGAALVVLSSDVPDAEFRALAVSQGLTCEVVARRDLLYEIVTVYRLMRMP